VGLFSFATFTGGDTSCGQPFHALCRLPSGNFCEARLDAFCLHMIFE